MTSLEPRLNNRLRPTPKMFLVIKSYVPPVFVIWISRSLYLCAFNASLAPSSSSALNKYKFLRRLALSRFFDLYDIAQKNPLSFLPEDAETIQESSRNITSKHAPQLDSRVLNRIVDLMFPSTAYMNENTVTAGEKSRRMYEEGQRAAAVKKIQDWRNG